MVGGLGPPAIGGNWTDAPAAGGEGLELVEGRGAGGLGEVLLDERTAERAGYALGDTVLPLLPTRAPHPAPTLVGIVGFPRGARSTAQRWPPSTPPTAPGACSSRARTPTATSG